jgi:hypothetical protein
MKIPVRSILFALSAMVLAACASTGTPGGGRGAAATGPGGIPLDASPEERAVAKWVLLINGDFGAAWEFLTPGARSAMPRDNYVTMMTGRPINWLGVRYIDKTCEREDSCLVSLEIPFQAGLGRGVGSVTAPSFIAERWLRLDGVWYYAPADLAGSGSRD